MSDNFGDQLVFCVSGMGGSQAKTGRSGERVPERGYSESAHRNECDEFPWYIGR